MMVHLSRYHRMADLILQLQSQLHEAGLWQEQPVPSDWLESPMPFACDQMTLVQWLQFVFIPRMKVMLEQGAPLPERCALKPYAEYQWLDGGARYERLLVTLGAIDSLLADSQSGNRHG